MEKKKVLKIILIIVAVILILFLENLIRKTYIIEQYSKKGLEYATVTNFYRKISQKDAITEIWRKGDIALYKRTSADGERMIYWGEDSKWLINNTIDSENNSLKVAVQFTNNERINIPSIGSSTIQTSNLWQSIIMAFRANITTENVNNEECYKIHMEDNWEEYITKKDFLMVKNFNGSRDEIITEYKIDGVTDEEVKMPDLTGYEIKQGN